jgi:hypothetical protein
MNIRHIVNLRVIRHPLRRQALPHLNISIILNLWMKIVLNGVENEPESVLVNEVENVVEKVFSGISYQIDSL